MATKTIEVLAGIIACVPTVPNAIPRVVGTRDELAQVVSDFGHRVNLFQLQHLSKLEVKMAAESQKSDEAAEVSAGKWAVKISDRGITSLRVFSDFFERYNVMDNTAKKSTQAKFEDVRLIAVSHEQASWHLAEPRRW
ncbi:MAG: hypothetical protein NT141_01730 [candidate division WWE3 bacterium]|nr:hypothetical protein [candidate division WWE3 bacterium]